MNGLKVTVAHEFFHAVQVGSYGIWTDIQNSDFYFYELSSVWMEDLLFTDVNDYLYDVVEYFLGFRDVQGRSLSFVTFNVFYQGYERALWAHYLAKRYGNSIVRQTWEAMRTEPFLKSMNIVLGRHGTNLESAYATFAQWNYFTGLRADTAQFYSEGNLFPLLRPNVSQSYDASSSASINFGGYPLSAQVCFFHGPTDSVYAIIANVDIVQAMEYSTAASLFEVRLSRSEPTMPYQNLKNGLKAGFSVSVMADWRVVYLQSSTNVDAAVTLDPFPNPVQISQASRVTLPVTTNSQDAEVFILSSSLDLVFSGKYSVIENLGKRYVYLPTSDFSSKIASGVYFVVVRCQDVEHRWKIAVIH